jgi:opacity protein-like surface antigen
MYVMDMKSIILALAAAIITSTAASAQSIYHQGYTTQNGTYVAPHYQSAPNGTRLDNWSTQGNVNPYTGQMGTRNPYGSSNSIYGR